MSTKIDDDSMALEIDGRVIGDGRPGQIALALRRRFHDFAASH